jgi:hypothetical protein
MSMRDRRGTGQAIAWVRDMFRARQLDLDPPYQRRSVWNRDFKQFFIDTILRNYPVPPIFVNMEIQDDGTTVYHVVDGKQRLLSILEFLEDEFPVSSKNYSPAHLAGKYFSQLDPNVQRAFYSYFLPFEFFTEITDVEVNAIFDRFNRNVQRLNAQELRHARYSGEFISLMENLADEPFWNELGMFGKADVRRMKDVEYTSIIFSLTMHGIEDGDSLDLYYAEYDDEIPEVGRYLERYHAVATMVMRLQEVVRQTRLKNRADFYSLWSALLEFTDEPDVIDYNPTANRLTEFANSVSEVPKLEDPSKASEDAVTYSQAVRAGTTKQPNRERRKQILLRYIVHK